MNKEQFVFAMLALFNKQDKDDLIQLYNLGLATSKNVDWTKLYHRCINQLESRKDGLPLPAWFKNQFDYCLAGSSFHYRENDGTKVIVTLQDGYQYEFELFNCNKSQREISQGLKRKFAHRNDNGELVTSVVDIRFIKEDKGEYEQAGYSGAIFA